MRRRGDSAVKKPEENRPPSKTFDARAAAGVAIQ
jgi:hypothetical protein